jgi:hypothetical protein
VSEYGLHGTERAWRSVWPEVCCREPSHSMTLCDQQPANAHVTSTCEKASTSQVHPQAAVRPASPCSCQPSVLKPLRRTTAVARAPPPQHPLQQQASLTGWRHAWRHHHHGHEVGPAWGRAWAWLHGVHHTLCVGGGGGRGHGTARQHTD